MSAPVEVEKAAEAQVVEAGVLAPSESDSVSDKGNGKPWWRGRTLTPEKKLLLKLDAFILSWACFGYFLRLLDTTNMTNAYVSGMKEELELNGDQYNLFTTFWTIGYTVGMIPSQYIFTYVRPSYYIPACEICWAIITFCFAAVSNAKQIYAMRFLIGLLESPFYIGAMTLLGNWYKPDELAKRAGIFYSASFAANMFSGYLQAGVYKGMNGLHGLGGWRWLFIMCGVITVPGSLYGFFAVPDSPYNTKARYLTAEEKELARTRMTILKRKPFAGANPATFKSMAKKPFIWVFVINYIFFCLNTYPLAFFAIYVKSLQKYSVSQVNTIPTSAHGAGLIFTIFYGFLSDRLRNRTFVAVWITLMNLVANAVLAAAPNQGAVFFGYIVLATTFAYGPIIISFLNETFSALPEERALALGFAQAFGAAFTAWVPILVFNTGKQAPLFHLGYSLMTGLAGAQALGVLALKFLGRGVREQTGVTK